MELGIGLIKWLNTVIYILAYFCLSKASPLCPQPEAARPTIPDVFPVWLALVTGIHLEQPQWLRVVNKDRLVSLNPS